MAVERIVDDRPARPMMSCWPRRLDASVSGEIGSGIVGGSEIGAACGGDGEPEAKGLDMPASFPAGETEIGCEVAAFAADRFVGDGVEVLLDAAVLRQALLELVPAPAQRIRDEIGFITHLPIPRCFCLP